VHSPTLAILRARLDTFSGSDTCASCLVKGALAISGLHDLDPIMRTPFLQRSVLLTPRLVGNRIGLHPVAVIFSVLAGGQLFGFTGVLLALPTAAVLKVWLRHIHEFYVEQSPRPVRKKNRHLRTREP